MKRDQAGSMHLVFIGLLAVLLAVGVFVAWRISTSDDSDDASQTAQQASQEQEQGATTDQQEQEPAEEQADGLATYSNEQFGFSFDYPDSDEWQLVETEGVIGDDTTIVFVKYDCGPNCGNAFTMILDSENPTTVQDWKDQLADNAVYELSNEQEIQLGSVVATQLTFSPQGVDQIDDIVYVVANEIGDTFQIQINSNGATTEAIDITDAGLAILDSLEFAPQ